MGTFEKLGILVIVVIIVMILAVAISQWGGISTGTASANEGGSVAGVVEPPLTIRNLEDLPPSAEEQPPAAEAEATPTGTWPGGVPRAYTILPNDMVWVLVVRQWGLKETFIPAIAAANPRANMRRLQPGDRLVIPDPKAYLRGAPEPTPEARPGSRAYEVQNGDTLELIAHKHLGSKTRWPDITKLNPGLRPHRLSPGQVIYVPAR